MPTTTPRTQWPTTLQALALLFAVVAYAYWPTLSAMFQIWWRSDTYTHGMLVPFISAWLIWRKREQLAAVSPRSMLWPVIPLALAVFAWLLGELTAVNALTQFALIFIVVASAITLLGNAASKVIAFPLLFLFFALPVGDFLMPRLMEWTADFTVLALRVTGIPVYREGQNFVIPSGHWSVVEACSGIRYLIASLTVGTLYAYLTYTSLKKRIGFILVSLFIPIVANWLRAYLIVMLGHLSGNKLAAGVDHLIYGWVFFGAVLAIMFSVGMRWADPIAPARKTAQETTTKSGNYRSSLWFVALVASLIAIGPLLESHLKQSDDAIPIKLVAPTASGPWQSTVPVINWQPSYARSSGELHTTYRNDSAWVGLYVAYYKNQNQERKLVTSTNTLVESGNPDWQTVSSIPASALIAGKQQDVRQTELLRRQGNLDDRYIVWQWYWINGHTTTSDIKTKLLTALAMLSGNGDDSATIILYSPKATANQMLPAFADEMGSEILRSLNEAKAR